MFTKNAEPICLCLLLTWMHLHQVWQIIDRSPWRISINMAWLPVSLTSHHFCIHLLCHVKHITTDRLQPAHLLSCPVCLPCVVQGISIINSQLWVLCESKQKSAPLVSVLSPLSYPSFDLSLQQNSITLTLPYNHFSSLRLDSFPGQTEKSLITLWPWLTPFHLLWFPLTWRHSC